MEWDQVTASHVLVSALAILEIILQLLGSRVGAVVRALASHQCVPGSIPGPGVICGLSLLLVLYSALRGFSPGTPVFPSHQQSTLLNSNSIWKQWMKSHLVEMPLQIPLLFIIMTIIIIIIISYFNIQKLFVGIVWIVDNIDLLFVRESSVEMQDLHSSTWYTARIVSVRLRHLHSILSL